MTVRLQPLLTSTEQLQLTMLSLSWQMPSFAPPLTPQLRLHLCGASSPGQGANPPTCHATPGGTPSVSCFSHSCARPSSSAPAPLTSAFCSVVTRAGFATAGTTLLSVELWSKTPLSQLLKTNCNPHKFRQMLRLPSMLLPAEFQDPAAWDSFLIKLTAPPALFAAQLPAPRTAQPPPPAHNLNQPLTWLRSRWVYSSCTTAGQEPCTATPHNPCAMPSLWPPR